MTGPTGNGASPSRRSGSLRMIERYTGGTNVVILTSGKSEKDPEVKNRTFAVPGDKTWLVKDIDPKALPIDNIEFTADSKAFLTGIWLPQVQTPTNNQDKEFHPASDLKTQASQSVLPGSNATGGNTNPATPPGKPGTTPAQEKPPAAAAHEPVQGSDNDARRDPAWTNGQEKERWLRYIASLNTANKILDGLWQPDPAKPQAEQIADKLEWIQSVAAGIRKKYEKGDAA